MIHTTQMNDMNRRRRIAAWAVVLALFPMVLPAQVTVVLQRPPPFQFKLEHMWKVSLINPSTTTYTVYLRGVATEDLAGTIVAATTASFSLPPGVHAVNSRLLVPIQVDVTNSKYANVIENIGAVPTGDYNICVTVVNAETGLDLGVQCMLVPVQNLSAIELLMPEDRAHVNSNGSVVTFSWLPPAPIPPGVVATYSIRIAEIFGNQSPYDAITSNPAFFKSQNISSTILSYPLAGRRFHDNKRYAWQVNAYLNDVMISESETWEFAWTNGSQESTVGSSSTSADEPESRALLQSGRSVQFASADNAEALELFYQDGAEDETQPLLFSGNVDLGYDGGYKNLPFSEVPKNTFTAQFHPSLAIYGFPFTIDALLTTQEASDRQSMNSISLNFDHEAFKQTIKRRLGDKFKEKVTGWDKLMLSVEALGIGTNYPSYTDYTVNGVPVTGVNIEINPGIVYAAFTASKNQRAIEKVAYQRDLYAGRLGLGKKEGTHIFFTGVHVRDDEHSIVSTSDNLPPSPMGPGAPSPTIDLTLTPQASDVFGVETRLALFDDHVLIEGEGSGAVLTRDTRDAAVDDKAIPGWIKGIVSPKISTSFDYAYAGKVSYNNSGTASRVSVGVKMVGPGYTSLGAPNLRSDRLAYEARLEQKILAKKISFSTFLKTSRDNLIEWKRSTTTTTAYGVTLGLMFPKLPFLQLSYSPYLQKNDDTVPSRMVENRTTMYSAMTGYTMLVREVSLSTNVSFSHNDATSLNGSSDFRTNAITVSEAIALTAPVSFVVACGSISTISPLFSSRILNGDFSVTAVFTESVTSTLGVNTAGDRGVSKKTGMYVDTNISITEYLNFTTRLESTSYKGLVDSSLNYDELLFRALLSLHW